jgi:hypothetical protein
MAKALFWVANPAAGVAAIVRVLLAVVAGWTRLAEPLCLPHVTPDDRQLGMVALHGGIIAAIEWGNQYESLWQTGMLAPRAAKEKEQEQDED